MSTATATKPTANGAAPQTVQTEQSVSLEAGEAIHCENVWEAFGAMQSAFPTIAMDKENKHFGNWYASLSAIMDAIRPVMGRYGFAWITLPTEDEQHGLSLLYELRWRDGAVVAHGSYPLPGGAKPQDLGSAITYARRYTLCAVLGIVADADDDGEAANNSTNRRTRTQTDASKAANAADRFKMLGLCPICKDAGLKSKSGKAPQMMEDAQTDTRYCSGRDAAGKAVRHTEDQARAFAERTAADAAQDAAETPSAPRTSVSAEALLGALENAVDGSAIVKAAGWDSDTQSIGVWIDTLGQAKRTDLLARLLDNADIPY